MKPILQNRWKIEDKALIYYGIRKKPYTLQNRIRVSSPALRAIGEMDGVKELAEYPRYPVINKLVRQGVIVDRSQYRIVPNNLESARFCRRCAANDYVIPGLEFNRKGLCPLCANKKRFAACKSVIPMVDSLPPNPDGPFDAAVFYTGGKDSTFLLYYLAKVLNLRVAALTWTLPFLSENAKLSIRKANDNLPNVRFISKSMDQAQLSAVYRKLYELQGNTCACPSLAYLLFYPFLVRHNVPYLLLGNEPVQMKSLLYNQMAPEIVFHFAENKMAGFFMDAVPRLLRKTPSRPGQLQMLMTVKQLAFGDHPFKRLAGYRNQMVENVSAAIREAPGFLDPIKKAILYSERTGRVPALVHMDFNAISPGGVYHWSSVKKILADEMGWVDTPQKRKGLHTSCKIERCKEYTQFKRFRNMESRIIPFSALELSLASGAGHITRTEAIREMASGGFTEKEPPEMAIMRTELYR